MIKRYMPPMMTLFILAVPVFTHAVTWEMDPAHSSVQFKVRHMTVSSVKGDFSKFRGVVTIDDKDITQMKVEMSIEAASVNTDHAQRDDHLRGPDFFDVVKYPAITFVSSRVIKADGDKLKVTGDLTLHGVTREITVDVEGPTAEVRDPGGNFRRGATATAKINRRDFGLAWNKVLDSGGLVVGDEVNIYVEVELIRK